MTPAEAAIVAGRIGRAAGELTYRAAKLAGRNGELGNGPAPISGMVVMMTAIELTDDPGGPDPDEVADAALDAFTSAHDRRVGEMIDAHGLPAESVR